MAIQFEFYESPDATGENVEKYHARTVILKKVTTEDICHEIQHASSLTEGDIRAVLTALSDSLIFHMSHSHRVHLEGIGYFQPTLRVTREIIPDKTRAQSVWFKSVSFKPDKRIVRYLGGVFTERAEVKVHSAKLTNEQVDEKVTRYIQKNEFMTRKQMQLFCGMTKSTTQRHITRMLGEGKLMNKGTQKQPLYVLT